jgi:GntR family transcriptional regulator of vanillate catabolism
MALKHKHPEQAAQTSPQVASDPTAFQLGRQTATRKPLKPPKEESRFIVDDQQSITVTEHVTATLREWIIEGKYGPGQRLQEVLLATELAVSRTPIRDALRTLATEELLLYSPNRGYIVRGIDVHDVLHAYDVRGALEGMACRVVAERGVDAATEARFRELIASGDEVFNSLRWTEAEQAQWRQLNVDFHFAIVHAARNRHLDPMLRQIRRFPRMFDARLDPKTDFYQKVYTRSQRLRAHHEHISLVEAIMRREGARAEALMREHVYRNREVLRSSLDVDEQRPKST